MWASLYQGTRLRSSGHLVSGKCQTQEYGAAMWPGKENQVLLWKCSSQLENIKVGRSRVGSPLLPLSW